MQNDFLAQPQTDPFDQFVGETETPSESPAEKEPEKVDPPQEGGNTPAQEDIPFHEHPRFKELVSERNQFKQEVETFKSELEELKAFKEDVINSSKKPLQTQTEAPQWFQELYGNNPEVWEQFKGLRSQEREDIVSEAVRRIKEEEQQKQREEQAQLQWVEDELQKLKDAGLTFDRNKLLKYATEYAPTDENGISLRKAYDIMMKLEPPVDSSARKAIAAAATTDNKSKEVRGSQATSIEEVRRRGGWNAIG